jgi:hypothetical protein
MVTQEAIDHAVKLFGKEVVYQAMEIVAMSDPDGAWTMLESTGQFEMAEAIEFLYFDGAADN